MALNASVDDEGRGAGRRRMRVDYYFSFLSFGQLHHFFPLSLQKGSVNGWQLLRGNKKIKDKKGPFITAKADVMATAIYYFFSEYKRYQATIISRLCHAE